jgi:hypothetical protein
MSTQANEQILNSDFIVELAKACLTNHKVLEICQKELKYQYLENEAQKNVFKYLYDTYNVTSTVPSVGVIGQNFSSHAETISFLAQVKKAQKPENEQLLLTQFEEHIKKVRFAHMLNEAVDLFNKQQKERAYQYLQKQSEEIANFTFKQSYYTTIIKDFEERIEARKAKAAAKDDGNFKLDRIPFGIHGLDEDTNGGMNRGSSACFMARSGKGKSTAMRHVGLHNAILGATVVHFQAEGTEDDCLNLYDSAWTNTLTDDMAIGSISDTQLKKTKAARATILRKGGEIYVRATETFDSMSLEDARQHLLDIQALVGQIDLIIFDYLEIFTVRGNFAGEAGERRRREELGNKMTNLAVEFNAAVLTATQANDIKPEDYNKPDWVLTRHHISEFKGAIKPFSYFITINQTDEQYKNGIAVLYADKYRHHKAGGKHPIYQALNTGRFYDAYRTMKELLNVAA